MKEKNIQRFRADWTNKDEDISQALQSYGRNSIPTYIYYDGKTRPKRLSEVLSNKYLSDIINEK